MEGRCQCRLGDPGLQSCNLTNTFVALCQVGVVWRADRRCSNTAGVRGCGDVSCHHNCWRGLQVCARHSCISRCSFCVLSASSFALKYVFMLYVSGSWPPKRCTRCAAFCTEATVTSRMLLSPCFVALQSWAAASVTPSAVEFRG